MAPPLYAPAPAPAPSPSPHLLIFDFETGREVIVLLVDTIKVLHNASGVGSRVH